METAFSESLKAYMKDNFNYDPAYDKEIEKIKSSRMNPKEDKTFDSLNFPQNEEIGNSFIYHALKILDKISLGNKNKEKIFKLLSSIYLFFEDDTLFEESIEELQYPFKFSKDIEKCFKNKKNYISFQIFNMAILLREEIDDKHFQSMNFVVMDIIVLYIYIFLEINSEIQLQIIISKIISVLFNDMIKINGQNIFIRILNPFFFNEGNINYIQFLKPKESNKKLVKEIFLDLEKIILNMIKNDSDCCDNISEHLIIKINSIELIKLIEKDDANNSNEEIKNKLRAEDLNNNTNNLNRNVILNEEFTKNGVKNENLRADRIDSNDQITQLNKNNFNINNKVNELNDKVTELSKDNINLNNTVIELKNDNINLNNTVVELKNDNLKLNNIVTELTDYHIIQDNTIKELNNKITKLTKNNTHLTEDNITLKAEVKQLNNNLKFSNQFTQQLYNEIQELKKKINNRDFTINQKEQEIKRQKDELINTNKEKKELSSTNRVLSVEKATLEINLKKKTEDFIELNKKQKNLKNENENVNNENIELKKLNEKLKKDEYEKILIGARDFLKLIINDLCYYFDVKFCDEYSKTANNLIETIKQKNEIKSFIDSVELINFLGLLGTIIDKMDQISHKLFPELSFKYRESKYNKSEEEVKENIKLCMATLGNYVNQNFDLLTIFFNEYYDYPKYAKINKNNIKGNKNYLFDAIQRYEKENNIAAKKIK